MKYINLTGKKITKPHKLRYTYIEWKAGQVEIFSGNYTLTIIKHELYTGVGPLNGQECIITDKGFVFPVSELERIGQLKQFLNNSYEIY